MYIIFQPFPGENGPMVPFVEVFHSLRLPFVGSATRGAPQRCVFGAASAPRGAAHGAERGRRQGTWGDGLNG